MAAVLRRKRPKSFWPRPGRLDPSSAQPPTMVGAPRWPVSVFSKQAHLMDDQGQTAISLAKETQFEPNGIVSRTLLRFPEGGWKATLVREDGSVLRSAVLRKLENDNALKLGWGEAGGVRLVKLQERRPQRKPPSVHNLRPVASRARRRWLYPLQSDGEVGDKVPAAHAPGRDRCAGCYRESS